LALTDALGNLVDFCLMPGQAHDLRETDTLIRGLSAGHLLADKALDADWLRNDLLERDIIPVIPPKSNRKFPATFGKETYRWRPLIEDYLGKLKENRGIAMRSCKTDQSVHLQCGSNYSNPVKVNSPWALDLAVFILGTIETRGITKAQPAIHGFQL
jgi:transposase